MTDERSRRISMVYELAREAGFEAGEHPAPERILEYQEGLLPDEEVAEVADHLALCPDCTHMVLELSGIVEPELSEERAPLSKDRLSTLWPELRQRLPLPARPKVFDWRRGFESVALPLAASFFLATVAASFWAMYLSRENHLLAGPKVNVAICDLVPLSEQQSFREEGRDAEVPSEAEAALLVLNLADLRPFPRYRAEIFEVTEEKAFWTSEDLQRNVRGNFTIQITRPFPGSGVYRVRLFGVSSNERELLAEYKVTLRDPL